MANFHFEFDEFNYRRWLRGAPAARVNVIYQNGDRDWLWMDQHDIRSNVRKFGKSEGLDKALAAYAAPASHSREGK